MRSHRHWLTTGLLGLALATTGALLAPTSVGAQNDTTPSSIEQPLPELAPGESPEGATLDSGPVLTLVVPDASTSTVDVAPAGPVIFDPTSSTTFDGDTRTVMFLLILTAVPSLTVGTALWIHRDQALSRHPERANR